MADNASGIDNTQSSFLHFYFKVDFGNGMGTASFQEVSGLEKEPQIIKYRHGDAAESSSVKMPTVVKYGNITLKKGIIKKNQSVLTWFSMMKMNTIKRSTVIISLVDVYDKVQMTWTLKNAFPVKIVSTDLKSNAKEMAIENIELAYESFTMQNI
ncbi:phage tail protein [Halpernia frigidisoli]|uniref:Conserved hypothetical phage tail region protein n=1 Tax=Halpernia frigidisoli TaxID=1125876 RepID=A0A1I3CQ52_9FLAO|nr:phage tail protein [Halpernia frigidisoli]SFH76655.1 conserved hypothetical phage tail region protein [Halpernia frigidisoli]